MPDSEIISSWDDPATVTKRLAPALQSRGISASIVSCAVSPLGGHSGLSGDLSSLQLTFDDTTSISLVLKRTLPTEDAKKYSKKLGLYREGVFYSTVGPWIQQRLDMVPASCEFEAHHGDAQHHHSFIPQALFAASDAETGQKAIVLDFYSNATEAGVHFPHSVHNVIREMDQAQNSNPDNYSTNEKPKHNSKSPTPSAKEKRLSITLEATRIAASLHGSFYRDNSIFTNESVAQSLRMADWIQGEGKESFLESQKEIVDRWSTAKERWTTGEFFDGKVKLSKEFVEVMDASCALALDFDSFVSKWNLKNSTNDVAESDGDNNEIAWCLVHGDYHPGNMLCLDESNSNSLTLNQPKLILLDWEVVGVGSGPQDIGQFLISHTETQEAFNMLDEVVIVYRQSLISTLDAVNRGRGRRQAVPSLEAIKREMVYGGIERWVWLFGYMAGWEESIPWLYMQYFHDQMQGWIVVNGVTPESVGMPRP
ncbi:hypothetical protein HJC23_006069 [Cyclotella cryptica]|uniref:Aminoglycoside phosphotransferase domain-containing protein n=1 Tax=Cyclotella cryptica TaxID=29204 RepID=A0ABD3PYZ6_9STRA|eukprot:CCRYP_011368-RA/>CCRYP_011368-RA protein AED:0.43 eAED:0.43 QI:0/-1/0/1/-1/1/1/0/481